MAAHVTHGGVCARAGGVVRGTRDSMALGGGRRARGQRVGAAFGGRPTERSTACARHVARGQHRRRIVASAALKSTIGSSWPAGVALGCAAALAVALAAAPASLAIYDEGEPIEDPDEAMRAAYAARQALPVLSEEISALKDLCPAPTFPCDLGIVSKKASRRVSGPLKQSLLTLIDLGADFGTVEEAGQSIELAEGVLYQNNARVSVDFDTPPKFLALADSQLQEIFESVPPELLEAAKAAYDACDMTVPPEAPGSLECRIRRAVEADAQREIPQGVVVGVRTQ